MSAEADKPEPLAWALAALMQAWRSKRQRAELRLACLRRILTARGLTKLQRFRLVRCVQTYIDLDREAKDEYDELLARKENRKMRGMIVTWDEKMEAKGYARGGVDGMRRLLRRLLEKHFGRLPSKVRKRLSEIDSEQELTRLAERFLEVDSLEELGLA